MRTPDYIKNTYTPTEYGQPIQSPTDPISKAALYAFKEDPRIVLYEANEERKKYKQQVKDMANDTENYIPIRSVDNYNIQGAIEKFKEEQRKAQREAKKRERMNKRNKAIETSLTAIAKRKNTKGTGQGTRGKRTRGKRTRRTYKKSHKTMKKHRKRTHRRR